MLLNLGAEVHQSVGEVGPHNRPPVASPVCVILLNVILILISRVQDNNLMIRRRLYSFYQSSNSCRHLNDKEEDPAPHVAVASLELIEDTKLRKYFI